MPKTIRKVYVGDYSLCLRERLPHETIKYATRFAVQTCENDRPVHLFYGCFAYGDDPDYVGRKFDSILRDLCDVTGERPRDD